MSAMLMALVIAVAVSAISTPLFRHLGRRLGLVDTPNERSSHAVPTPRNGGKAIMLAIVAAFVAMRLFADATLTVLVVLAVLMAILGIVDDARNLSARVKLAVQLVLAAALLALPSMRMPMLLAAVALIWLAGVTNGFNFMDGVNGIASLEAMICGVAMGLLLLRAGDAAGAALAFAVAGAAAGFFPWNAFTGSIFMGDVGSLPLGFLFAALLVRGAKLGIAPWIMAAPLLPFLLDTGITLVRRALRRERVFEAHRSHFYQQLTDLRWSHLAVTLLWGAMAALAAAVALEWATPAAMVLVVIVQLAVLATIAFARARRRAQYQGST